MTHLYSKIQADQLHARKGKHTGTASILTYLLGEIGRGKTQDFSDKNVLAITKTTLKRLKASQAIARTDAGQLELEVLNRYLPQELSGIELHYKIRDLEFTTMPEAMKKIKQWDFAVNMQEASKLVREMLA
jgi:uncharacterized protein YqeY